MALMKTAKAAEAGETVSYKIERRSLFDDVVDRLRDMIVEGELTPGERVPERILCEQLGISRTPLREALKVLAHEGLIELLPNRGAMITEVTDSALEEMFEVMGALDALAGELACQRITEPELAEIRASHARMIKAYEDGNLHDYFKLNQAIHELIVESSKNATLLNTYYGLAGRMRRARYRANLSDARWRHAIEEHEQMLKALEARDGDAMARIMRAHLRNKAEAVFEAWG